MRVTEPTDESKTAAETKWARVVFVVAELALLMSIFFIYAGDLPPMVNEAHYLVKAKNFWQPEWCAGDLFASSGKAHTTFYVLFGWPTLLASLQTTAWIGRLVGWLMLAIGLQRLSYKLLAVRFASLGVATIWIAGVEYGNLAGEWVVGGIEAKVPAYGLVLLALAEMVDRKWYRVWPLLGAASAFHVLSGGWSVLAAMLTWWVTERGREDRVKLLTPALFVGGALSLFGLVPALALTLGANPDDATAAARIYAYFRIKHHLLPADFFPSWYVRHGTLILGTLLTGSMVGRQPGWRRMRWFTFGALAIAAAGLLVGMLPSVAPDLAARLLRYYWFRLTDAAVPLMFALSVMGFVVLPGTAGAGSTNHWRWSRKRIFGVAMILIATTLMARTSYQRARNGVPPSASNQLLGWDAGATTAEQKRVYHDWLKVCRWAQQSTDEDEVFLTPRHQQTFKWYADRAEVVNWKDVPQDAASLKEWYRRFRDVFPQRLGTVRVTIRYDDLRRMGSEYGVRYIIVDRRITGSNLPLVQVYPSRVETNESYAVYRLPTPTIKNR